MNELEEIRKKKLEQLQNIQQQNVADNNAQQQEELKIQQQIDALEQVVKTKMTRDALSRYGNLKTAHPEKSIQLLAILGQLIQSNDLGTIDDDQLKQILVRMNPPKKEIKITRK